MRTTGAQVSDNLAGSPTVSLVSSRELMEMKVWPWTACLELRDGSLILLNASVFSQLNTCQSYTIQEDVETKYA